MHFVVRTFLKPQLSLITALMPTSVLPQRVWCQAQLMIPAVFLTQLVGGAPKTLKTSGFAKVIESVATLSLKFVHSIGMRLNCVSLYWIRLPMTMIIGSIWKNFLRYPLWFWKGIVPCSSSLIAYLWQDRLGCLSLHYKIEVHSRCLQCDWRRFIILSVFLACILFTLLCSYIFGPRRRGRIEQTQC